MTPNQLIPVSLLVSLSKKKDAVKQFKKLYGKDVEALVEKLSDTVLRDAKKSEAKDFYDIIYALKNALYDDDGPFEPLLHQLMERTESDVQRVEASLSSLMWQLSVGVDFKEIRSRKIIPVAVYFQESNDGWVYGDNLIEAVFKFLYDHGIERFTELPPVVESWWKEYGGAPEMH